MSYSVRFPNLALEMIASLNTLLAQCGENDVLVSIERDSERSGKQITIRADGGNLTERVLKVEGFGINVWANNLDEANELSTLVEALIPLLPRASRAVREAEVTLSPTRLPAEGESEHFYLTGEATVRGTTFALPTS